MKSLDKLIREVGDARQQFIKVASGLTHEQYTFKFSEDVWSIVDNVEHLVWAEQGGINGIWKTHEALKRQTPLWTGEAIHHGLSIEQIIEKTWKPKEQVPEVAKPRWGGPVSYWIMALNNCQPLLISLGEALAGADLEKIIYPHIISGPLNVIQRMEFLRFHLHRHQKQMEAIKAHPLFLINKIQIMKTLFLLILCLLSVTTITQGQTATKKHILVHVTQGPENPTRAALAFLVAKTAIEEGHTVTLFLAGDGVQLLRNEVLDNLTGMGTGKLREHFDAIVKGGGKFYLSGMSSKARGITEEMLKDKSAEFAMPNVLVRLSVESDKMFVY